MLAFLGAEQRYLGRLLQHNILFYDPTVLT